MLNSLLPDTLSSIRFLSRLSLGAEETKNTQLNFQKTAHTFPLAALFIALPAGLVLWICTALNLQPTICALLALLVLTITTGALHEDGLADTVDGFWGGRDVKRKLEIMRDSSIGTYGVLALLFSMALRVVLLSSIISAISGYQSVLLFLAVASVSRFAMLGLWQALPAARTAITKTKSTKEKGQAGLSTRYGAPDFQTFTRAAILCLPAGLILIFIAAPWSFIASLLFTVLLVLGTARLCEHHIGGHTGDTLGATQQVAELGLLFGLALTV